MDIQDNLQFTIRDKDEFNQKCVISVQEKLPYKNYFLSNVVITSQLLPSIIRNLQKETFLNYIPFNSSQWPSHVKY